MSDLTPTQFVKELFVISVDSLEHSALGSLISYECPECKQSFSLQKFEGNLIEGLICPNCHFRIESKDDK